MECPRCGEPLDRYALAGRVAVICESCGYVGVPVEHRGAEGPLESWDDAVSRLAASEPPASATVETSSEDPTPSFVFEPVDAGSSRVACGVCGEIFDTQSQLNGHMAVHADEE